MFQTFLSRTLSSKFPQAWFPLSIGRVYCDPASINIKYIIKSTSLRVEYHKLILCLYMKRDASMMSMRRKIAGLRPDQIKQLAKEELDLPVSVQDFNQAISKCNKSVSKEDLDKYEKWMNEFGSSW